MEPPGTKSGTAMATSQKDQAQSGTSLPTQRQTPGFWSEFKLIMRTNVQGERREAAAADV